MGLFSSSKTEEKKKLTPMEVYGEQIQEFLLDGEEIEEVYGLYLDFMCITNKRLIFVDEQIIKDPKTLVYSVAFKNIIEVAITKNEKLFAMSDELTIVTRGQTHNIKFRKYNKAINIIDIYKKIIEKSM